MRRRRTIVALGATLSTGLWPPAALAQPANRIAVIGRMHPGFADDPVLRANMQGFHDGMRALGHVDGRTYRVEVRFAEGDAARLPSIAAAFVGDKVDLIMAAGAHAIRAAKEATSTIPIVMAMYGSDAVGEGMVASLSRPGGNVTGITGQIDEVQAKQLELLREIIPGLTDVLVLFNRVNSRPWPVILTAAASLGLRLHLAEVRRPEDLNTAFAMKTTAGAWAVLMINDPALMDSLRAPVAALALQRRLPTAHSFYASPDAGVLVSYAVDLVDMNRRTALIVDKIFKGMKPADIPIERPTKFELVVNQRTARAWDCRTPIGPSTRLVQSYHLRFGFQPPASTSRSVM